MVPSRVGFPRPPLLNPEVPMLRRLVIVGLLLAAPSAYASGLTGGAPTAATSASTAPVKAMRVNAFRLAPLKGIRGSHLASHLWWNKPTENGEIMF